ncbi:MAG: tripartite tricarboxylate transporter TctB family protein [Hyphomicrobiales bacterium]
MFKQRLTGQLGVLAVLAIALFFIISALVTLDLGTVRRMGPGAFPLMVGGLLAVLTVIVLVQNLRTELSWSPPDWMALLTIGSGVAAFALLTPMLGVLPAVFLSVLFSSSANREVTWLLRICLAFAVAFGVWLIFLVALQMPFVAIRGL